MFIYLLRHGDAPFDPYCGERSLSAQGEIETRRVIQQQRDRLSSLQLIVCSPVLRARQTVQIVTDTLNYTGQLLFDDVLRSEGSIAGVERRIDFLMRDHQEEEILLLSHQPLIGQILEYLTGETGLAWSMNTSSLASLEAITFGRGCAELQTLIHP
ncbi:MAG: histidine phosphatase family protein [Porticoccus sp.]|nr:histidine phosphatase family protein [Porticoccus sp.]